MSAHYREVLQRLRSDVKVMRESPVPAIAERILRFIDGELSMLDLSKEKPGPAQTADPRSLVVYIPNAILIREIARRMLHQHVKKICSRCHKNPVRALGLCKRCYGKAHRRGEIKNAGR